MATLKDLKKSFLNLDDKEKLQVLAEMYNYSNDMKVFLKSRLVGEVNADEFITKMERMLKMFGTLLKK